MNSDTHKKQHNALTIQRRAEAAERTYDYWMAIALYHEAAEAWDSAKDTDQAEQCRAAADRIELKVKR